MHETSHHSLQGRNWEQLKVRIQGRPFRLQIRDRGQLKDLASKDRGEEQGYLIVSQGTRALSFAYAICGHLGLDLGQLFLSHLHEWKRGGSSEKRRQIKIRIPHDF